MKDDDFLMQDDDDDDEEEDEEKIHRERCLAQIADHDVTGVCSATLCHGEVIISPP